MSPPAPLDAPAAELLRRALDGGRVHSAYLLAGPGDAPRAAAVQFVRGVVCTGAAPRPCGPMPSSGAGCCAWRSGAVPRRARNPL